MSAVRFTVTKAEDESPIGESTTDGPNYGTTAQGDDVPQVRIVDTDGKFGMYYPSIESFNIFEPRSDTLASPVATGSRVLVVFASVESCWLWPV